MARTTAALEPNADRDEADIVWVFDMIKELGVTPHNMSACSVTAVGDLLLVNTSNGADEPHKRVPAPKAPSFIALDKHTGKLVWADNSPGDNILDGQWSSPAVAVLGGVPQAIFPGGDGWVYSFRAEPSASGKPELLWKFDCNPKTSVWKERRLGRPQQHHRHAGGVRRPRLHRHRAGSRVRRRAGPPLVHRSDETRRRQPRAGRRPQTASRCRRGAARRSTRRPAKRVRPNPNSAAVWRYAGFDANGDGKLDFDETMHRTLSMAAIKDGLLVIADIAGLVHCLDAKTGKVHWTHDLMSQIWGSPCVVDGKIYIGNQDGDVAVFELSPKLKLLAKNAMGGAVYSTPVVADDVLYISTRRT